MKWIKIDDLLTEAPEVLDDIITVEFGGSYRLELTKVDGNYRVTNGVNGYGDNCYGEFANVIVKILTDELSTTTAALPIEGDKNFKVGTGYCPSCLKSKKDCTCVIDAMEMQKNIWDIPKNEFAQIKMMVGSIMFDKLRMSKDGNAIEANPAVHTIAEYICKLLKEFEKEYRQPKEETVEGIASTPKDASRNKVQLSNVPQQDGISIFWLKLWQQIEIWYGDITKKETGRDFLLRMQDEFPIASTPVSDGWIDCKDRLPDERPGWSNSLDVNTAYDNGTVSTGSYSYLLKKWVDYLYHDKPEWNLIKW